ncbi:S-adenosyl-L-methionine-dependent methyltransferase protein, partial [Dioscorea alata]
MSQEQQPRKPQQDQTPSPIKYGNVFDVSGSLSDQTIAPQDAALMQSAESLITGQTLSGGAASTMQSAATRNKRAGHVTGDDISPAAAHQGVSATQSNLPSGHRTITETVSGKVMEQYSLQELMEITSPVSALNNQDGLTIGEALEAAAITEGSQPVTLSDAAAIKAAEEIITGGGAPVLGGVADQAQSAAEANELVTGDEYKTKLSDILADATMKLAGDKVVMKEDAERVTRAELRNSAEGTMRPRGVA